MTGDYIIVQISSDNSNESINEKDHDIPSMELFVVVHMLHFMLFVISVVGMFLNVRI
jgi:hypothetical protein